MRYLDKAGLTITASPDLAASVYDVDYDSDQLPTEWEPGDTLITSPWSAHKWSYLPRWVSITLVPDGGEVSRFDPFIHALKSRNLPVSYAKKPPLEPVMPKKPKDLAKAKITFQQRREVYESYLAAVAEGQGNTHMPNITVGEGPVPYTIVTDPLEAARVMQSLHGKTFAFDYETTALDWKEARILGVALADSNHAWYVANEGLAALPELVSLLKDFSGRPIASNCKYEYKITAASLGAQPTDLVPIWDTQVMHWLLAAGGPNQYQNDLKSLTKKDLKRSVIAFDDIVRGDATMESLHGTPDGLALVARYAAGGDARNSFDLDAKYTQDLYKVVTPLFDGGTTNLLEVYRNIELPLTPVLAEMELAGMPIDQTKLRELYCTKALELRELEDQLRALGFAGNPAAGDQVARWFYEDLKLPIMGMTTSGSRGSVKDEVIRKIIDLHPAVYVYLKWSSLSHSINTFLYPPLISGANILYTSLNQTSTGTGRLSSSGPNLQNQPIWVKEIFTAPDMELIGAKDYSQIEPRIGAVASGDQAMLAPYLQPPYHADGSANPDADSYIQLGLRVSKLDPAKVLAKEKKTRTMIKALFLGCLMYGGGAGKIQEKLLEEGVHETLAYCRELRESGQNAFPDYLAHMERTKRATREVGAAFSMRGRRQLIPQIWSKDPNTKAGGERVAINMICQGSAADFIKEAMPKVQALLRSAGGTLRNQVHDELVYTISAKLEKELDEPLTKIMEECMLVPLRVDGGTGSTWYEAKPN